MRLLIKNSKGLVQVDHGQRGMVKGREMAYLPVLENAWLAIENDSIVGYGEMHDWEGITDWNDLKVIDATGKYVFPSWCDSHTHCVFAGSRESEFVDRIKGLSYEHIAQNGGGILNSAKRLCETSEEELFESAFNRLKDISLSGTGAIEIKSGYGLSVEGELKMLRVIKKLKASSPLTIKATFLGAHAIPAEYKTQRETYIKMVVNEMIPLVSEENLADFIDVFCETNYFTPEETDRILKVGAKYGLLPKIHVNQFTAIGGVQIGVANNALSVDHLEVMRSEDIAALKGTTTIATVLPSCSFFLSIPYAPVRQMIDEDISVALATDYNPGSSPSGNMSFVLSLACIKYKITPEEAVNAATLNGAYAMNIADTHGSIGIGKKANLFITKEMPTLNFLPYSFGSNLIETIILNGEIQN